MIFRHSPVYARSQTIDDNSQTIGDKKNEHRKSAGLEATIGQEVRSTRIRYGINFTDLAERAGISVGMLSKVENGGISPSLGTLQALSSALGVPLTALFRRYDVARSSAVFVKAGEGVNVERRGTPAGHQYNLPGYLGSDTKGVVVERYLITLSRASDEFPTVRHGGMEFLYMLEGEILYQHDNNLYRMTPGDCLLLDANTKHGPKELTKMPIRFLLLISYCAGRAGD